MLELLNLKIRTRCRWPIWHQFLDRSWCMWIRYVLSCATLCYYSVWRCLGSTCCHLVVRCLFPWLFVFSHAVLFDLYLSAHLMGTRLNDLKVNIEWMLKPQLTLIFDNYRNAFAKLCWVIQQSMVASWMRNCYLEMRPCHVPHRCVLPLISHCSITFGIG